MTRRNLTDIVMVERGGITGSISGMSAKVEKAGNAVRVPGQYTFRTPAEARELASRLACLAPKPTAVETGLFELFMNAIEHGNLGIGREEKRRLLATDMFADEIDKRLKKQPFSNRLARVEINRANNILTFRIQDEGEGFDWEGFDTGSEFSLDDQHGRGILIARKIAFDHIAYSGNGNCVTATVELSSGT